MSLLPVPNIREQLANSNGLMQQRWFQWLTALVTALNKQVGPINGSGFTGTIATAKLTAGGANGSMTFQNGVLTSQVQAT